MLDINLVREEPEKVKKNLEKRNDPTLPEKIDQLLQYDREWRERLQETEKLKALRNDVSAEIADLEGEKRDEKIEKMRKVAEKIDKLDGEVEELDRKRIFLLDRIPNLLHDDVPFGEDDSDNVEVRSWGKKKEFDFEPKDHIDLCRELDLFDLERAAKVSGSRFYFLKNELVLLSMAILRMGLEHAMEHGFTPFFTPELVREKVMYGTGFLPVGSEDIFRIEGKDLCLVGTTEVPLGGLHMDEILEADELPLRYTGVSSGFRTEAGSHGKDTKGIFRVHQFRQGEMFVFAHPDSSWDEHERLIGVSEKFWQKLGIPYRVVNICTGDLGVVASKKYDIEAWLPGQERFREVVSCSNCTGYQSRRMNTRFREKPGEKPRDVHTLNCTVAPNTRAIIAILENYQREDGSVEMPKALRTYLPFDAIEKG